MDTRVCDCVQLYKHLMSRPFFLVDARSFIPLEHLVGCMLCQAARGQITGARTHYRTADTRKQRDCDILNPLEGHRFVFFRKPLPPSNVAA